MSLDLSITALHTFLSTHNGRDQVGKFVQYATRGIVGALTVSLINSLSMNCCFSNDAWIFYK
jgi:hypothetical protein